MIPHDPSTDWRHLARRYARKYGFPEDVFERQMGQEAGGKDVTSGAGAQGPAQIMPATAAGWGLSPSDVHNIDKAYDAAARNMAAYAKKYGGVRNALIAYNAGPGRIGKPLPSETQNYLKIILGGRGASTSSARAASLPGSPTGAPGGGPDDRLSSLATVFQRLNAATPKLQPYKSPFSSTADQTAVAAPNEVQFQGAPQSSFSPTTQPLQSTFQPTQAPPSNFQPTNLGDLLSSLATSRGGGSSAPGAPTAGGGYQGGPLTGGKGDFHITGPNPGRIQAPVSSFMARVADVYGSPITGSDGTGHSKYTVNGNVSEHFTGSAVDNPAKGDQLTKMGQAALIAAGMDPAKAKQQKGGLYNIYGRDGTRYQIIFNTTEGGNHWDHLHVGVKPGRGR